MGSGCLRPSLQTDVALLNAGVIYHPSSHNPKRGSRVKGGLRAESVWKLDQDALIIVISNNMARIIRVLVDCWNRGAVSRPYSARPPALLMIREEGGVSDHPHADRRLVEDAAVAIQLALPIGFQDGGPSLEIVSKCPSGNRSNDLNRL